MSVLSRFAAPSPNNMSLQASSDKFTPFISSFLSDIKADADRSENRTIKMLAYSPESKVMRALLDKAGEMAELNIKLELILADLPVGLEFESFLKDIEPLLLSKNNKLSFRWAKNPCLLDAHEQMILGSHSSWSGDVLKRVANNAYHIDMFEAADLEVIKLGQMAFSAMWVASTEVPSHRLKRIMTTDSDQKKQLFSQVSEKLKMGKWNETSTTCH